MTDDDRVAFVRIAGAQSTQLRVRLIVLTLLAMVTAPASVQAQRMMRGPGPAEGLIVGRVVDTTGRPVAGAIVALTRSVAVERLSRATRPAVPPAPDRMLTGPDGFFVFRDLPLGNFTLTAAKPGYSEGAFGRRRPGGPAQQLPLTDSEYRREIAVLIWKHGAITGVVTDEIGEPLIGIAIQSFKRTEVNGVRRFVLAARAATDDRGVYRLPNLPPGEYMVAASNRQVAAPLSLADQSRDRRAAPVTTTTLGGPVPMPGSGSGLQLGDSVFGLAPDGATPPPPEGDRLWIYPPTFHPATPSALESSTVTLRSGEERDGIDLQLRPVRTVRISGFLTGPADMLAHRRLRLVPADSEVLDAGEPVTATDVKGAFVFPAVPAGEYSLTTTTRSTEGTGAPARTFHWAEVPITVGREDLEGVHVLLRPGATVSGNLVFDGRRSGGSVQQARIVVERANAGVPGSDPAIFATIDDVGEFTATGLAAGFYFVRVLDSPVGWMFTGAMHNGRDLSEYPVEVREDLAGVAIEFTNRWTGIRGIVTTPSGQIDSGAIVLLFPTDAGRWRTYAPSARRMRSARVRDNGEFSLASVPVGEYYLTSIADEDAADWQDPAVLDALARTATRITINEGDQKTVTLRRQGSRR